MANENEQSNTTTQARLIRLQIAATIAAGLVDNPALDDAGIVERALHLTDKLIKATTGAD